MKKQTVIAVFGVKNAGKTTLIEKLIPALTARGLSVATVKHDGHRFEPDRPGTDSYRHLAAGAMGTAVYDGKKFQLVNYAQVDGRDLIALFPEADLILLEGFKHSAWPRIEVVRKGISSAPACDKDGLLAIATDIEGLSATVPVLNLNDITQIADCIVKQLKEENR